MFKTLTEVKKCKAAPHVSPFEKSIDISYSKCARKSNVNSEWATNNLFRCVKTLIKIQNQVDFWKSFLKFLQTRPPFKSPKNARRGDL